MARPSKIPIEVWAKARALYESDKSLRDIEKITGINNSNIAKKAHLEKWQRGVLPQLIEDTIRVKEEFTALLPQQQEVVTALVDERTRYLKYFKDANLLHSDIALKKLKIDDVNISYSELNSSINVISKAQEGVMGKAPDTNININTGQQETPKRNALDWLNEVTRDISAINSSAEPV